MIGAEFALSHFQWSPLHTGYTFALFGALGVICLLSFDRWVMIELLFSWFVDWLIDWLVVLWIL